jgi:acylphosphatase
MGDYARLRLTVTGTVQGVGYRFFAVRAARRLGLFGWVKNRSNGSVEIVAEGPAGMLKDFVAELRRGPASADVAAVNVLSEPYRAEFKDFDLKF